MGANIRGLLLVLLWSVGHVSLAASRRAVAEFAMNGAQGVVVFDEVRVENSTRPGWIRIDATRMRGIALQGALSWHVHEFPFKYSLAPAQRCGSTGGHYDPFAKGPAPGYAQRCSPSARNAFRDCEVGDLSGKFGPLRRKVYQDRTENMSVAELVGRSVVLHESSGKRWACANIVEVNGYTTEPYDCRRAARTRTLVAQFNSPVAGTVYMRQLDYTFASGQFRARSLQSAELPVTSIFSELAAVSRVKNHMYSTVGLNWTIHIRLPNRERHEGCGMGPVYTGMTMGRLRAETLPRTQGRTKLYAISRLLAPLERVNHRDLVLSDPVTSQPVACAPIEEVRPVVAEAAFHRSIGRLLMAQASVFDTTHLQVNLSQLANIAADYSIKEATLLPMTQDHFEPDCITSFRSGVFNPFAILRRYRVGTADMFPVSLQRRLALKTGDLSGKYGTLQGRFSLHGSFCDSNLPLYGAHSVIGRSAVVTRKGMPAQAYTCARVTRHTPLGSHVRRAVATVYGAVTGRIELEQTQFPDGSLGETKITFRPFRSLTKSGPGQARLPSSSFHAMAQPSGQSAVSAYPFHVHQRRIGVRTALTSVCDPSYTGHHYNPHNVSVDLAYESACSPEQPHLCELGDTAGKVGPLQIVNDIQLRIDPMLPLAGPYSVIGRSFVVHGSRAFGGLHPVACGNILPPGAVDTQVTFLSRETSVQIEHFKYRVAVRLHIHPYEVLFADAFKLGRCTAVTFALQGVNAPGLADQVRRMNLGEFTHDQNCEDAMRQNANVLYRDPKVVEWLPSWVPLPKSGGDVNSRSLWVLIVSTLPTSMLLLVLHA